MADIAFLLLVFFLVTTTLGSEIGLIRKLPPAIESTGEIIRRNVLEIRVNSDDKLLIAGEYVRLNELKNIAKLFIENPEGRSDLPEKKMVYVPELGEVPISRQVISLQNDLKTSYGMYVSIQDILAEAYAELRDEYALQVFDMSMEELETAGHADKIKAIRTVYPMRISEAEPNS